MNHINPGHEADMRHATLKLVLTELLSLRAEMVADAARSAARLELVHPSYRDSARNLIHYLALRRRDIRPLQRQLTALGLSSIGRAESHVLATVDAILEILHQLTGTPRQPSLPEPEVLSFSAGSRLLAEHTEALLGPIPTGRASRIMVTIPGPAADDYTFVRDLLERGMDCMRINCAHDDVAAWTRMIKHVRKAQKALGRSCRVVMDLAGPKLRTGPLVPGPAVIRIRPRRDAFGRVSSPARVWLTAGSAPHAAPSTADACLPVPEKWLSRLRFGDRVKFTDARDSKRTLVVVDVTAGGCWLETTKTAYLVPGTLLRHKCKGEVHEGMVGALPPTETTLFLLQGDRLIVTRNQEPGRPAVRDAAGQIITPAMIGCTLPEVFEAVRPGESIWFDDGKIGGVVENVQTDLVVVRIMQTRLRGEKLRADKGINLPDSVLRLPALTTKDLEDLTFVSKHADVVELSFANCGEDVKPLQEHLERLGGCAPSIVLKIETRRGFENLPDLLLTAMGSPCCGVMIARGDLAVECGFQRLAEVQEEILWICEAAPRRACPRAPRSRTRPWGTGPNASCSTKGRIFSRRYRFWMTSCAECSLTKPRSAPPSGSCGWRIDCGLKRTLLRTMSHP
jgi:pyruvate kinase